MLFTQAELAVDLLSRRVDALDVTSQQKYVLLALLSVFLTTFSVELSQNWYVRIFQW